MRLEQRIEKLESSLRRRQQLVADDIEIERTDEEEADWTGDLLWWPKEPPWTDGPAILRLIMDIATAPGAWKDAARLARQQGHTDYHVGLRPYALAVWLQWKPSILKRRRTHGRWIWDVPPRINSVTMEEFKLLPIEEKAELVREPGKGHWSKL